MGVGGNGWVGVGVMWGCEGGWGVYKWVGGGWGVSGGEECVNGWVGDGV